jgi:putative IMPACT (imprinted ancient) family translation regulator
MAEAKPKIDKSKNIPYVKRTEDEARLEQLIEQAENRSVNEQ